MAQSTISQSTGISYTRHIYIYIYINIFFNVLSTVPRENRLADSLYIYIIICVYLYINKYTPFQKCCNLKIHIKYMYTHNGRIDYCQHPIHISQCGRASLPSSVTYLQFSFYFTIIPLSSWTVFSFPCFLYAVRKEYWLGECHQ